MIRPEFTLSAPLIGITRKAARGPDSVEVETTGFYTSDDGPLLYNLLDAVFANLLAPAGVTRTETVRSAFASIQNGVEATVLVNPATKLYAVAKGPISAGQQLVQDDLADVTSVSFDDYVLPTTGALVYVFEHGWRRGLYFDYRANVSPEHHARPLGDVGMLLGSLHAALLLRERVRLDPTALTTMAEAGWFPFTRLPLELVVSLEQHVINGWPISEAVDEIVAAMSPLVPAMVESWAAKPVFQSHLHALREAAALFAEGRFRAAAMMAMPKVEGVLQRLLYEGGTTPKAWQLQRALVGRIRANVEGYTALLPEAFVAFLRIFHFANFEMKLPSLLQAVTLSLTESAPTRRSPIRNTRCVCS